MSSSYERQFYADVSRVADNLENINETLEKIRWQMVKDHEQRSRNADTDRNAG